MGQTRRCAKRKPLTEQALLAALRRFRNSVGRSFTTAEWDARPDRPLCSHAILRRFGSWRAALRQIGLDAKPYRCTDDEILDSIEHVAQRLGRPPRPTDLARHGRFSRNPIIRLWGSPRRACHLFALFRAGHLTRRELLSAGPAPGIRPRRGLSLPLRWRILKRDHYRCAACGRSPATNPGLELHIDHIFPISRGGSDDESNLRTLCRDCNWGKRAE